MTVLCNFQELLVLSVLEILSFHKQSKTLINETVSKLFQFHLFLLKTIIKQATTNKYNQNSSTEVVLLVSQ